jgi:ketosteroid isomerase-like protein
MTDDTAGIVRAYHEAWTRHDFEQAAVLLAPALQIEVPINDYPSKDSFVRALAAFGSQVTRVEVLSELSAGDEAMLLYDMEVEGLGPMRIVEHFTIADGKIARLRQIHDTAAFRTTTA